tara:strand:+ start:29 stop:331 length:303 start_codon:yes stop_codon:yes gene_type:complete
VNFDYLFDFFLLQRQCPLATNISAAAIVMITFDHVAVTLGSQTNTIISIANNPLQGHAPCGWQAMSFFVVFLAIFVCFLFCFLLSFLLYKLSSLFKPNPY